MSMVRGVSMGAVVGLVLGAGFAAAASNTTALPMGISSLSAFLIWLSACSAGGLIAGAGSPRVHSRTGARVLGIPAMIPFAIAADMMLVPRSSLLAAGNIAQIVISAVLLGIICGGAVWDESRPGSASAE